MPLYGKRSQGHQTMQAVDTSRGIELAEYHKNSHHKRNPFTSKSASVNKIIWEILEWLLGSSTTEDGSHEHVPLG